MMIVGGHRYGNKLAQYGFILALKEKMLAYAF